MSMFQNAKRVNRGGYQKPQNAGFVLKLAEMKSHSDKLIALTGTALSESAVSKAGEPVTVLMDTNDFKYSIGHNLARSLRDGLKRDPDWFAGTDIILSGCFAKDDEILAKRGAVGTYCVAGHVDSPRSITNAVVGRPVIELVDAAERATVTMTAMPAGSDSVEVRIRRDGHSEVFEVPVDSFVETLGKKVAEQTQINTDILAGKGFEKPVLKVSVNAHVPKEAFDLTSADHFEGKYGNWTLMAANGAQMNVNLYERQPAQDVAKILEHVGKFTEKNHEVKAVPFYRINYNKQKAVEVAEAYANYLATRNDGLSYQERWKSHEKVLSSFNNLEGKFTPSNLILESFPDKDTKEMRFTLERIVPAANRSVDVMPDVEFNGLPPAPPIDDGMEVVDVADIVGVDGQVDAGLVDAAKAETPAAQPARRPRSSALSM